MKQSYIFALLLIAFSPGAKAQNCTSLGCAANYGSITVDATVPDAPGDPNTCYVNVDYKHVYWQFFYSPTGGDFTQTYTPTSTGDPLDIDYIVYDIGTAGPSSIICSVNTSTLTYVYCNILNTSGNPTGPGVDGTVNTVAGHYYAVAVYIYQDVDPTYTFDIGTPQIGGFNLTALNCPGVLPVKLSSFEATANNCSIGLNWESQNESFFKQYEIEYSFDGGSFYSIATLPARHGSTVQRYSYQHNTPQQGNIFYRLKMVDMDGRLAYSKTIAMKLDCKRSNVFVYPNPVSSLLNVNLTNADNKPATAQLFDNLGKLVHSGKLKSGTNTIDMAGFSKGIYILSINNDEAIQYIKIIK